MRTGIDVVDRRRFDDVVRRRGAQFLERVFSAREIRSTSDLFGLAHIFAAKEAVMKCLGTGLSAGISWHDIEILPDASGNPEVVMHGRALDILDGSSVELTVGGTDSDAVALAIVHRGRMR